jgi:plastocyanin
MTHSVIITPSGFKPETLTVKAGDTVTWKSRDQERELTIDYLGAEFDSVNFQGEWSLFFEYPGKYDYSCGEMKGTIKVDLF